MKINLSLVFAFVLFIAGINNVSAVNTPQYQSVEESIEALESMDKSEMTKKEVKQNEKLTKKLKKIVSKTAHDNTSIVAILACFFLGGLGIHRVVMGSKPIMILWYILTLFGIFGIVPFIDLIAMIINPDKYKGNDKYFGFL